MLPSAGAVLLVDGGTDILMRGDEAGLGTPEEDMASLAAVAGLREVSMPSQPTSARQASRSGRTPTDGKAHTVSGIPCRFSQRARVRSGK
ncbi:hypothetical protein ACFZDG_01885 [Kitasatospora xanthocidica]|uniref:hypothetical protein n=1 Tax=Kitasatospora xanthocidica TaxID=83382 RepID=UPI0036EC551E